jgi:hypothetical protein
MSLQIDSAAINNAAQETTSINTDAGPKTAIGVPYVARVDGKTFSTNVQPFANEYVGNIPNLPGASTTGETVKQVEGKLSNLISFFA